MSARAELQGRRFGKLRVIAYAGHAAGRTPRALWECRCDCGAVKIVRADYLQRTDRVVSCGCGSEAMRFQSNLGDYPPAVRITSEYQAWKNMIYRCTNPKSKAWKYYGARGIKVCDRWLGPKGFANFLADMGAKPNPDLSIDRINNDGNYEPNNCRWATWLQQGNNLRRWPRKAISNVSHAA